MKSGNLTRPLTRALQGIRKQNGRPATDAFREHLALRMHLARLLGSLSLDQVRYLVERAKVLAFRAGETVLDDREAARNHLLLLRGTVRIQQGEAGKGTAGGHTLLQPMDVMGGFAFLNANRREQGVTAASHGHALLIDADLADALLGWNELFSVLKHQDPKLWQWIYTMRDVRVFSRIPAYRLDAVIRNMTEQPVAKGTVVARAGDPADAYHTLQAGQAEVWRRNPVTDREECAARLGPGEAFGAETGVQDARYTSTVRMVTAGRLRSLSREDLEAATAGSVDLGFDAATAREMLETGTARLLDCRYGQEVLQPRIPGARVMPLDRLRWEMHGLDHGMHYIVYCRSGGLAQVAAHLLRECHFRATALAGGIEHWPYGLE
jgi:CRP-like cAMP-binding protein